MAPDFERYRELISNWAEFRAALERPLPTCVWTHPDRVKAEQVPQVLGSPSPRALAWYPGAYRVDDAFPGGRSWQYCAGLYQIQEEVSLYPVGLLNPQPGERVLDLCAAPGNKTAQLSFRVGRAGTVIANDLHSQRIPALRNTIERLGLFNVATTSVDGRQFPLAAGAFDRVLVDAPCSCEGTTRKSVRWKPSRAPHPRAQHALLTRALRLCRPGGTVVYSTCTYAPEENELVIDDVLRESPDYELIPSTLCGFQSSPGITYWQGRTLRPELEHCARIWPHLNDTGGFFAAALKRKGDENGASPRCPARQERVPPSELEPFRLFNQRFHFQEDWLAHHRSLNRNRRGLYLATRGVLVPTRPGTDTVGILSLRLQARPPKLTTAACLEFGRGATQAVVELREDQATDYVRRRPVELDREQTTGLEPGYVIARCLGHPLGMAYFHPDESHLDSMYPRGWMWGRPATSETDRQPPPRPSTSHS